MVPAGETLDRYMARTPLRRLAEAEDIAEPILFFASGLSRHVTGTILPVDGGYLAVSQMTLPNAAVEHH